MDSSLTMDRESRPADDILGGSLLDFSKIIFTYLRASFSK